MDIRNALIVALLLSGCTLAQSLPDAPSYQQLKDSDVRQQSYPDYSEHLTWRGVFTSKRVWISEGVMAGSMIFDIHQSLRGLHDCPWLEEKSQFWWVGPRPTAGQLVTRDLTVFGIVTGVNLLASKYLSPWVTFGTSAGFSARHIQGGVAWMHACP